VLQIYDLVDGTLKPKPAPASPEGLAAALWIDLWDPKPEELRMVEGATGTTLHLPDAVERFYISDQVRASERQLTLQALLVTGIDQHAPKLIPVTFIRSKGPMITISKGSPDGLAWLVAECQECVATQPKDLFPNILDMVIDYATGVLDHIGGELDRINRLLFQHHIAVKRRLRLNASPRRRNRQLEGILTDLGYCREVLVKLRRSVLSFRRLVGLLSERAPDETIARKLTAFEHELSAIAEAEVDLSSGASFMLDGAVGYIGILQSKTINIMTILGVLLTPPVLVASVYGMNFPNIPELHWTYGYAWALGLMVLSGLGMYVVVRLRGWL
jgi:magnesium transporter